MGSLNGGDDEASSSTNATRSTDTNWVTVSSVVGTRSSDLAHPHVVRRTAATL